MKVPIINKSPFELPSYATTGSAGLDLRANISEAIELKSLERRVIPTGLYLALPQGYEGQVRPRSGLALKKGLSVPNAPGTIDSDYRGEVGVLLINLSAAAVRIEPGERVAQLVIAQYRQVEWEAVSALPDTERAAGGFGSTGQQ